MPASQVDEQVVKMSFDNSNFDSNINDSIKTLNTLDRSLALFNSKESLNNINTSFNNLAHTFSIKGQIMFGVLNSLGKEIYGLGKRAFGSLTKGIRDGLGEYKTIIDSTEAIYQNVKQNGNSLQDVNNALDELNDYADKTIYNFGQMTRMIGMFSSAGVGLKDSVNSIKGLSNAAALVGANMQKAQIGWNAVSRSMSSGKFTNMTWRSLELSGIAGKQFNKVITEVARNMHVKGKKTGKDIDGMIKKYGSLRESLQEGWLKKDVFTEAMAIMSGELSRADLEKKKYSKKQIDELLAIAEAAEEAATKVKTFQQLMETISEAIGSGWAQSFRILLGDLEQAKKLYTRISNVISDFIDNNANIRNELFKRIINGKDKGIDGKWRTSRDTFRQIIENMLAIIKTFLKSVKTGFLNIFPIDRIAAAARKFLDVFEKFTRSFVIASGKVNKAGDTLWNTSDVEQMSDAIKDLIKFFRGLASAVDIAWMAISQPIKVIVQRIPFFNNFFNNTNSGLVGIIKKLGQFGDRITAFRDAAKDWEIFGFITEYILDNIDQLGEKYPVLGLIVGIFKALKSAANSLKNSFKQMEIKPLSAAFGLFKMVVTSLWKALNGLFGLIRGAARSVDWSWLEGPKNILKNVLKVLSDYGRGLLDFEETSKRITGAITGTFNKVTNTFGKVSSGAGKIKTATYSMEKQFKNLNVAVNSTGKKVQSVWDKVKSFFGSIADFFKNMSKNSDMTFEGIAKRVALIGGGVTAAALSITHLTKAFKKLNIMNNISDLLNAGINVLNAYQKQAKSKTILNIALAVGVLAAAMAALAFIPYDKLENGLTIFTAFMMVVAMTTSIAVGAITKFTDSIAKMRENLNPVNNLISSIRKVAKRFANGFIIRMIGKSFIDLAIAIAIVTASLIALKLVFRNPNDLVKPLETIKELVKTLTVAIGALIVVMEIFSRIGTKFSGTLGAFSGFLKLAGVSGIILSIAAAVTILVGALYVVSTIDPTRLQASWDIIRQLVEIIGVISIVITAIVSRINLGDTGKLKKITFKLSGAVAAMAAVVVAMSGLIYIISKDNTNSWIYALTSIVGVMSVFAVSLIAIMTYAKQLGGKDKTWKNLNKSIATMTVCMLALVAGLYALSYAKAIPASIVTTIGIITVATTALLIFIAAMTAKSKGNGFATDFVKVIQGLAFAVSALTASLGIMAAGLAAFIVALNSLDLSTSDAKKASNSVIEKLEYAGEVIEKSIPGLKTFFTKLGITAAEIFTSFVTAFFDTISDIGDKYSEIIEKVVNLIIDILGKVVGTLHTRKDDIAKIVKEAVEIIGTEVAAAINAFFSKDGKPVVSSEQVLNWIGIGGIGVITGKALLEVVKNFNAIATFLSNFKKIIDGIGIAKALGSIGQKIKDFAFIIKTWSTFGKEYVTFNHPLIGKLIKALETLWTKISTCATKLGTALKSAGASVISWVVAILGIVAGLTALTGYFARVTGLVKDSYNATDSWVHKITQVLVDGFKKLGLAIVTIITSVVKTIVGIVSGIVTLLINAFNFILDIYGHIVGFFNKDLGKAVLDWKDKYVGGVGKAFNESTENIFKSIAKDWKGVSEEWKEAFKGLGFDVGENYVQGEVNALKDGRKELEEEATKNSEAVIKAEKKEQQQASPSKVSYKIYWNYILGARNALSNGGKVLVDAIKKNNKKINKEVIAGVKKMTKNTSLEELYKKQGIKLDKREGINKYDISYYKYGDSTLKEVKLNKELTEAILEQKDALFELSEAEAKKFIQEKAVRMDIKDWEGESEKILDYLFGIQEDKTKILWSSLTSLEKATEISWNEILSAEELASKEALENQLKTNDMLMETAENKKKNLIGKSKEEAKEIIKNDLIAKGIKEDQAEDEAKKMIALTVANQKQKKTIEASGLEAAVTIMKAETEAYRISLKEQNKLLEDAMAERVSLQANADKWQKKAETEGLKTPEEVRAYIASRAALDRKNTEIDNLKKQIDAIVAQTAANMKSDGTFNEKKFKDDYEKAYKQANINNNKNKSVGEAMSSFFNNVKKYIPSAPDLTTWKMPGSNTGDGLKDKGKDAVDTSKDLKNKLEKNRADLTPTIDLDRLSNEAKKANGIVTSSLMAAQNASIGDYINKDSELNPFMKDRWQNVYNFTQNNYSPKALSRIDIYRQTQRQLGLTRGF